MKHRHQKDVDFIYKTMNGAGYKLTEEECVGAWQAYSDDMCAGWMGVYFDPDGVIKTVLNYLKYNYEEMVDLKTLIMEARDWIQEYSNRGEEQQHDVEVLLKKLNKYE